MKIKKEAKEMMKKVRDGYLPSSLEIVKESFEELGYIAGKIAPEQVKNNFENILREVWDKTLQVLEKYEFNAYSKGIPNQLISTDTSIIKEAEKIAEENGLKQALIQIFQRWYPYLREMFLSISQSRKTRGGQDFELQFGGMLDLIEVPYQKINRKYRVDFMLPNDDAFKKNPTAAAIVSAKRTLRERWREVVEELYDMRSPNIFIVTTDFNVTPGHVKSICQDYRIHLIVWDEVKQKFNQEPLVLSYNQWANERLPILMKFWE